MNRSKNNQ